LILGSELRRLLYEVPPEDRLVVTPILDQAQIGDSSIDVRLGNEFVTLRRAQVPGLRVQNSARLGMALRKFQSRVRIGTRSGFVLHPGELVLGCTLEYIRLPRNVGAYVLGRSSWGRLGLIIATAIAIAPGYSGAPTLELANVGVVPLTIYPGMRVGQLVFHEGTGVGGYVGRHKHATGPTMSEVYSDPDMELWAGEQDARLGGLG
jgi:dCTP deaminase